MNSNEEDKPRTYATTIQALTAAIQCGDGTRTAVLAREAVYMKTQYLARPKQHKNNKKKKGKGKNRVETPAPREPKKHHRETAIRQVRKVIADAIEHENASLLARDMLNDAVRKKLKTIDFDHVARETAIKKRIRDSIENNTRVTDDLRARLLEYGDGCLPSREDYFVHDRMTEATIEAIKRREIKELKTHLTYFNGSQKGKKAQSLVSKVQKRDEKNDEMNGLAAAMGQLSASYCTDSNNKEDGGIGGDMELDLDEVM